MTATKIDHKATAEILTAYHDARGEDWTPVSDLEVFALAQVHATLALVEQQRIANRLALSNITNRWAATDGVPVEILKGLGLTA